MQDRTGQLQRASCKAIASVCSSRAFAQVPALKKHLMDTLRTPDDFLADQAEGKGFAPSQGDVDAECPPLREADSQRTEVRAEEV